MIQVLNNIEEINDTTLVKALRALSGVDLGDLQGGRGWLYALEEALENSATLQFVKVVSVYDVYQVKLSEHLHNIGAIDAIAPVRRLRTVLNMPLTFALAQLGHAVKPFAPTHGRDWLTLSEMVGESELSEKRVLDYLLAGPHGSDFAKLAEELEQSDPHAVYPTSCYRDGTGHVVSSEDDQKVEAVMTSRSYTSIRVSEGVLNTENTTLADIYKPIKRCVAVVDTNVEKHFGNAIETYFMAHGIFLEKLVYRAMEVDKGIQTVEQMLGDFKRLGVSRAEPVLIAGGGVLSDTGGLACALYHRNTPYVMLSTSIVAGIDAGPSPRTCCDGFGYKNLFGAYHTPILSITDRCFFKTLEKGWIRHGIAEIIKMATVKDRELFELLEATGGRLIETRFGTVDCEAGDPIVGQSRKVIGAAIRSYVEAEYGNLYETHQCRPHAYGHTWSPGFEIKAGMLHGHAVAVGMGLGAFMSYDEGWIAEEAMHRILRLISSFELSLWHDILLNKEVLWAAQVKMVEKRGGNLAAPLPKGSIGQCGYLNEMTQDRLFDLIDRYRSVCLSYPREGWGVEPHCKDVGLEDPSTVGESALVGAG